MARENATTERPKLAPRQGFRRARPYLRRRRETLGLTLRQLAEDAQIPTPTLSRVESGRLRASPHRQEALSLSLQADVDALFYPSEPGPLDGRDHRIADDYRSGVRMRELVERYGRDRSVLGRIIDRRGVRRTRGLDAATVDALVLHYEDGKHGPKIAAVLEVPTSTVYYHLERRGVARRLLTRSYMLRLSAKGVFVRTGSTAMYGRYAKQLAAAKGKTVGRPSYVFGDRVVTERIVELVEPRCFSQAEIARTVSEEFGMQVSRDQVKRAVAGSAQNSLH